MRRLPVYFLIDISESMVGEPIQLVEEGMATIINMLKEDPYALETVHISVLVFAGQAKTVAPLTELANFYPPRLPIGGGTALGNGLGQLMMELRRNLVPTTPARKGDWKPIVFLFTDGVPTDDATPAIQEWQRNWHTKANLVAVSFGTEADLGMLRQLTSHAYLFQNTTAHHYKEFFRWITASIKSSSQSVGQNSHGFELAKTNSDVLHQIDLSKQPVQRAKVDANFAVFAGKCTQANRLYLLKFKRDVSESVAFGELNLPSLSYRLQGAYPVGNEYLELSAEHAQANTIHVDELRGHTNCPICQNYYSLCYCDVCDHIHCLAIDQEVGQCPWCGTVGEYGSDEGGFNLQRGQG